jgi:hypothetical protein
VTTFDRVLTLVLPLVTAATSAAWANGAFDDLKAHNPGRGALETVLALCFVWLTWVHCRKLGARALAYTAPAHEHVTTEGMSRSSTTFNTTCPCPHCQGTIEELRQEGERRMVRLLHTAPHDPIARQKLREHLTAMLRLLAEMDAAGQETP